MRFERTIEGNSGLEVDVSKWDCNREGPHCHITYNGKRIGQVWTSTITFKDSTPSELNGRQENLVLNFVRDHKYEIEEAYHYNAKYGAD